MNKVFVFFVLVYFNLNSHSQDYVSFRNVLNEANYWFYESEFDSAIYYYSKAEKFNLQFFPEEVHLFSRCLWEKGEEKKSLEVLKSGGLKDFFLRDTTYYYGLSSKKRLEFSEQLELLEIDLLSEDMDFFKDLEIKDQMYRKILFNYAESSEQFDSIVKKMEYQDSINFLSLIDQIKRKGYPGGYEIAPIGPGIVLLHAKTQWLLDYYHIFIEEIQAGRMNYFDFSRAIDRALEIKGIQKVYNYYLPKGEEDIISPTLVFINRCSIGMSPYYDIYLPRLYPRGMTPPKSKLYEFYKRKKQNFNCIRIK